MEERLFHFSDDDAIGHFEPRPVRTPSPRPPGQEWLNGPLVWAIDEWHQPMYLFPRECPRILIWRRPDSLPEDIARYFGDGDARMIAYVEAHWQDQLAGAHLHRYELPSENFEPLGDAGMWVSHRAVHPLAHRRIGMGHAKFGETAGRAKNTKHQKAAVRPVERRAGVTAHRLCDCPAPAFQRRRRARWIDPVSHCAC